jgi:hypothetical protein
MLALIVVGLAVAGCSGAQVHASYKSPEILPVQLSLSTDGYTITGDLTYATPIGKFSIGAKYNLQPPASDSIYVILRNQKTGFDQIFEVKSGGDQFTAVLDGKTTVSVVNNEVTIDVTSGTIEKISFKRVTAQVAQQKRTSFPGRVWHRVYSRWDQGWNESWYKPYALSEWAYSDSTIEKWYGVGFVWFLLRLVAAIVLACVDTILSLGFIVGQGFFILFGPTGRDVIYGLMILGVIGVMVAGANS